MSGPIDDEELDALRVLAVDLLALTAPELNAWVAEGRLLEICHDH